MPRVRSSMPSAPLHCRSDAELLAACRDRNEDAWRELVTRYGRMVHSISRHYGLGDQDCDDVFQNVFLALLRQLPRIRDRQSVSKWLITLTHRTTMRMWRRDAAVPLDGPIPGDADPPPDLVSRWEREQIVRQALRRLGGPCERLLTALYLDPSRPSYREIALRLDVSRGTIGSARARCLCKLVALLRSDGFEDRLEG